MTVEEIPLGLILAGGESRRFQATSLTQHCPSLPQSYPDKFLAPFGATTLLGHIITRAAKQNIPMILNVNGDPVRVTSYGLEILPDREPNQGPLGGLVMALEVARQRGHDHVLTFSADCPFFPPDYRRQLMGALDQDAFPIAIARSHGRLHPVMGVFPVSLRDDLAAYLASGERRVMAWIKRHGFQDVVWNDKNPDPFLNINSREDLTQAAQYLPHNI